MKPVRTCVGCRQPASKTQLLRVVCDQNSLKADPKAVKAGRGAWLHVNGDCLKLAIERNSFSRALRADKPEVQELITFIEQAETMLAKNE